MIDRAAILRRFTEAKAIRQPYEPFWQEITDNVCPNRSFWDPEAQEGKKPEYKIYDSTAPGALRILTDGMQGYRLSPPWFNLVMEDPRRQAASGVAQHLEMRERVLYGELARSNFYDAVNPFITDAATVGTTVVLFLEDQTRRRFHFQTRHMRECYIAEDRWGTVDTVFRHFKMTNRQMEQEWPGKLSEKRKLLVKENPDGKATILHVVCPRADAKYGMNDAGNKPWASAYLDMECDDPNTVLDEGGYDSFPYLVWRWRRMAGELYGRSPAYDAMADILMSNQMARTLMIGAQMAVQPMLNIPMELKGLERIVPWGRNYYTASQGISAVSTHQSYPIGKDQANEIKAAIRDAFRTKIFLLMEQLEQSAITATEIRERKSEMAAIMGAINTQLDTEMLRPLIARADMICERNGLYPPAPPAMKGGMMKVQFQGVLANLQRRYNQTQGLTAGVQFALALSQARPETADNFDWDDITRRGWETEGAPASSVKDTATVLKMRQIRAKAMQEQAAQQAAAAQGAELAKNADKLNQPLNPDSMLAGVAKAASRPPAKEPASRGVSP